MKYILKKGITLIITLFIVSIFTFTMFQVIPGDSALSALGMSATEQQLEDYREAMGLNKSLPIRYGIWLSKAITGDFGTSVQYKMPVSQLIRDRLPVTIWLAVISFILIIIVSLPLGFVSAKKKNHPSDHVITTLTQVSMAIPAFFWV